MNSNTQVIKFKIKTEKTIMKFITESEWNEYRSIQKGGLYNMFDPKAREHTTLNKEQWFFIIKNYGMLKKEYEGGK